MRQYFATILYGYIYIEYTTVYIKKARFFIFFAFLQKIHKLFGFVAITGVTGRKR